MQYEWAGNLWTFFSCVTILPEKELNGKPPAEGTARGEWVRLKKLSATDRLLSS